MRTLSRLVFVFVLVSPAAEADELRLWISFDPPRRGTSEVGELLRVAGAELSGRPGEPLLPWRSFSALLPHGHDVEDVRLTEATWKRLPGVFRIAPAQPGVPLSWGGAPHPTGPDTAIYGRDLAYPEEPIQLHGVQFRRGYAIALLAVAPLRYHPRSGQVDRLGSATLVLTTRSGGRTSTLFRARDEDARAVLRGMDVGDPGAYPLAPSRWNGVLEPGYFPYLIVTPEQFVAIESPDSLEALRDLRAVAGMPGRIVTLEWIVSHYDGERPDGGQDDATRLRNFLRDAYMEWASQWVLLVGDADAGDVGGESGDDLMPVRGLHAGLPGYGYDDIPADLYYACLDGSYDHDADGRYGEFGDGTGGGEIDLLPELYVGRAPADSAEEVAHFVAKTLRYEQEAGPWLQDVWMLGEYLWDKQYGGRSWGGTLMDELIEGTDVAGFTTQGFAAEPYFVCHTLYDRDLGEPAAWGPDEILPVLNAGPHIVNHLGHSWTLENMHLDIDAVDSLSNDRPFLLFSQGCNAGGFDNRALPDMGGYVLDRDCVAEHFVMQEHGALAVIMNSRYGLGTSVGTDGPSQRYHRQFWDAFFAEGVATIGEAFADCKADNAFGYADPWIRWSGFTINLLGDPALALKKGDAGVPRMAVYPPMLRAHTRPEDGEPPPVSLHVRNNGAGNVSFSAVANEAWVSVSPSGGGLPADLAIQLDPAGMVPGTHLAEVLVICDGCEDAPVPVPVELVIVDPPTLRVPAGTQVPIIDGEILPGEYDQAAVLAVDEAGAGDVTLYALVVDRTLFLAVDNQLDTSRGGYDQLQIALDLDKDEAWPSAPGRDGIYTLFAAAGGFVQVVPVFNPGGGYVLDPTGVEEYPSGVEGGAKWVDGHRMYEIAFDLDASRIDVGPQGSFAMVLSAVDSTDLDRLVTTGRWPWVVPALQHQRYFGVVDMAPEAPRLATDPAVIRIESELGGCSPNPMVITVFDREGGSIPWEATCSADWLALSGASGQTPGELHVDVAACPRELGVYETAIEVTSPEAWNSPLLMPVTIEVLPQAPYLAVDAEWFDLAAAEDGENPSTTFHITNLGDRSMPFTILPGAPWIQVSPAAGSLPPGMQREISLRAMIRWVGRGVHETEVVVTGEGADRSPATLPLHLEVQEPGPVPDVLDLAVEELDCMLRLSWQTPDDLLVRGVLLKRSRDEPPAGPANGDRIYDGTARTWTDADLENGARYCYGVFTYDWTGRFSAGVTACGIPGDNRPPPAPALLSPGDGALVPGTPELVASAVMDPDGDEVTTTFVLQDEDGAELAAATGDPGGSRVVWTPGINLKDGATYRWFAAAVDEHGAASGPAATRTFTLRVLPDAGVTVVAPPDECRSGCGCTSSANGTGWMALVLILTSAFLCSGTRRA